MAVIALIYTVMGILLVMLFAHDGTSYASWSPTGETVPGNILSALPSNSFENIFISIGMVISLIGSIPLFLEAASEILENKMGVAVGAV